MSTRSRIGILNQDNTVTSIYCHFDGYLSGVGLTLHHHYRSPDKIVELISLGDMSSLAPTIEESCFYGRDRGEDDVEAQSSINKEGYLKLAHDSYANFAYLWDGEKWDQFRI